MSPSRLVDDLARIRDAAAALAAKAEEAIRAHRYADRNLTDAEAILDILGDGEWHRISAVAEQLSDGGRDLEPGSVAKRLRELDGLESRRVRTGWQGGAKEYRLRRTEPQLTGGLQADHDFPK